MTLLRRAQRFDAGASMGPPREHGGMLLSDARVDPIGYASMGPPREHGGMITPGTIAAPKRAPLQWGRRVNTAECF